ncbi:Conserved_hypothetical protein [Hexamita inflata]|uniref:EF-hand domain-containing protein n=1 Tax=Hexamita inflata TaxID=28002 RepID=A0AA86PG44_9EUKA|nr:Conserved hypothetical protein [Hexamita inflata]
MGANGAILDQSQLTHIFRVFDQNDDGQISLAEFQTGLTDGGINVDAEKLQLLFKLSDTDSNGILDKGEFFKFFMNYTLCQTGDIWDLVACVIDLNGDNKIQEKEYKRAASIIGAEGLSKLQFNKMTREQFAAVLRTLK